MVRPNAGRARYRRAAGVHHRYHAVPARHGDIRRIFIGCREIAETRFGKPDPLPLHLGEVRIDQARLQDDGTGMHAHAARAIAVERFARSDGQRFDARRIARTARHVHFGSADAGGHAAMDIALQEADGFLARRVVAEGDVDMRVDQPRHRHHPAGIDRDVAIGGIAAGTDRSDLAVDHHDGVAGRDGRGDIAAEYLGNVENCNFHRIRPAPHSCAPPRRHG